jgi:hypothetical protein
LQVSMDLTFYLLLYQLGSFRTTYTIWRNVKIFNKKKIFCERLVSIKNHV